MNGPGLVGSFASLSSWPGVMPDLLDPTASDLIFLKKIYSFLIKTFLYVFLNKI